MSSWPVSILLIRTLGLPLLVLLGLGAIQQQLSHAHEDTRPCAGSPAIQDHGLVLRLRILSGELGIAVRICETQPSAANEERVWSTLSGLETCFEEALRAPDMSVAAMERLEDARTLLLVYRHYLLTSDNEAETQSEAPAHRRASFLAYMAAVEGMQEHRGCRYPVLLP